MCALTLGKLLRLEKADAAMDDPELHPSMAGHANPKLANAFPSHMPQSICGAICSLPGIFGGGGMREECEDPDMPTEVCYAWNSICHVCWGWGWREGNGLRAVVLIQNKECLK